MSQVSQNAEIWHEWLVSACPPCLKRLPSGSKCAKDHPQALHTDDMSKEEFAALDSHKHLRANERHQKMGEKSKVRSGRVEKTKTASQTCDHKQAPTKQLPADPAKVRRICDTCHVKHAGICKACIICKVWHKDGICPQLSLLLATTTTSTTQQQPPTSPTNQPKCLTCNCHHAGPCHACLTCMTFHESGICPKNPHLATDIANTLPTEIERQTYLFKMISRVKSQEELDVIVANLLNHPDQVPSRAGDAQTIASSALADEAENSERSASSSSPQPVTTTREARTKWFAKLGLEMCRSDSRIGMDTFLELFNDSTFLPVPKLTENDQQQEEGEEEGEEAEEAVVAKKRQRRGRGRKGRPKISEAQSSNAKVATAKSSKGKFSKGKKT